MTFIRKDEKGNEEEVEIDIEETLYDVEPPSTVWGWA